MKRFIYVDNAATTKLDLGAFEAMKPFLLDEYGNASQPYAFSRKVRKALKDSREIIASCIGAKPEEIYFTSGGTESNNWVIKESAFSSTDKKVIITSQIEHHAILRSCERIEQMGYPVLYLPVDGKGCVQPGSLSSVITNKTRLVSIMLSNNEIGSIQDISTLSRIAHEHGALFHTDAVQAVGHIPVDVSELGIDMLSASAHKFNGPKGVGFLYKKRGIPLSSYESGGSQENGLRAGTENIASIVGMAYALKANTEEIASNMHHLTMLEDVLLERLREMKIDFIHNGSKNKVPGNISLSFAGFDGEALLHRLDLMGICVSTGSACDSKETQVSHVLQAIGLEEKYAKGTIRISLGKSNTIQDVADIITALGKILTMQR